MNLIYTVNYLPYIGLGQEIGLIQGRMSDIYIN